MVGETREERAEGVVVFLQLLDVAGLTGPVGEVDRARGPVLVVGIGDVRVGNGDAGLLHLGDPGQRDARFHPVEAREADVVRRVLDHIAVEVGHGA